MFSWLLPSRPSPPPHSSFSSRCVCSGLPLSIGGFVNAVPSTRTSKHPPPPRDRGPPGLTGHWAPWMLGVPADPTPTAIPTHVRLSTGPRAPEPRAESASAPTSPWELRTLKTGTSSSPEAPARPAGGPGGAGERGRGRGAGGRGRGGGNHKIRVRVSAGQAGGAWGAASEGGRRLGSTACGSEGLLTPSETQAGRP